MRVVSCIRCSFLCQVRAPWTGKDQLSSTTVPFPESSGVGGRVKFAVHPLAGGREGGRVELAVDMPLFYSEAGASSVRGAEALSPVDVRAILSPLLIVAGSEVDESAYDLAFVGRGDGL